MNQVAEMITVTKENADQILFRFFAAMHYKYNKISINSRDISTQRNIQSEIFDLLARTAEQGYNPFSIYRHLFRKLNLYVFKEREQDRFIKQEIDDQFEIDVPEWVLGWGDILLKGSPHFLNPISDVDLALRFACINLDYLKAKQAIDDGADPHFQFLYEDGGLLYLTIKTNYLIEMFGEKSGYSDGELDEKASPIIELLLSSATLKPLSTKFKEDVRYLMMFLDHQLPKIKSIVLRYLSYETLSLFWKETEEYDDLYERHIQIKNISLLDEQSYHDKIFRKSRWYLNLKDVLNNESY